MRIHELVAAMDAIAPVRLAAAWDNVGLLVGDPEGQTDRVLLTVDCTRKVLEEARRHECRAVISYHPPLFEPQKRFTAGDVAFEAARAGIAIYTPHTALDAAEGGTNDVLADAVGLVDRAALRPVAAAEGVGFGRVGPVRTDAVGAHARALKRALGVPYVLVAGDVGRVVGRVAVCAGSGGDLVPDAIAAGAELFVTGELRHHDTLRALDGGLAVLCTRHSVSERGALAALTRRLEARLPGATFLASTEDREPLEFV